MPQLPDLIERLTTVYRRGEEIEQRQVGSMAVTEFFGYPHTTEAAGDETLVDLVFVNVGVHIKEARALRDSLLEALVAWTDDDLAMVFMPLALGGLAGWDLEKIGLVFEEISKAGPRSINGRPCFFSCQFLHIDDLEPFTAEVKRMAEALGLPT